MEPIGGRSVSEITSDLEVLKRALVEMTPDDLDENESEGVAREISAIRLQLKRLAAERRAIH